MVVFALKKNKWRELYKLVTRGSNMMIYCWKEVEVLHMVMQHIMLQQQQQQGDDGDPR